MIRRIGARSMHPAHIQMVRTYPDGFSKGLGLQLMPAVDTCLTSALPQPSSLTRTCIASHFPSSFLPSWPPSSRGILSPSPPLALLYDFAQIHNRPYLNRSKSILKAR